MTESVYYVFLYVGWFIAVLILLQRMGSHVIHLMKCYISVKQNRDFSATNLSLTDFIAALVVAAMIVMSTPQFFEMVVK